MGMLAPALADDSVEPAAGFAGWTVFALASGNSADNQQDFQSSPASLVLRKSTGAQGGGSVFGTAYDVSFAGRGLLGVFADVDLGAQAFGWSDAVSLASFNFDRSSRFDVGGRLGIAANERQLLYVTGGYTRADYTSTSRGIGPVPVAISRTSQDGWFTGIGFDYRLSEHADLKTEYRMRVMERGEPHVVGTRSWSFEPIDQALLVGLALRPFGTPLGGGESDHIGYFENRVSPYVALGGSGGMFHALWQGYSGSSSEDRAGQTLSPAVTAGLDLALNDTVFLGAVASYQMRDAKSSDTQSLASSHELHLDDAWSLGMRAGVRTSPGTLYVGGGFVRSSLDALHFNSAVSDVHADLDGYYASLGTEVALGRHLGVQLEYRLENYGTVSRTALPIDQELDVSAQSINASLVLRN